MNVLFPQFLYGLIALAIPIIIHLFNFRRTKKVYFSNNRFLTNIKESNSSRLKLKHLLVLFSRLLFIFFLVLAFSQPYLSSEEEFIPNNYVKVYVDNSYSMSNQTVNEISALDEALNYAETIVSIYPKSTKFQLFTNEFDISSESILTYEAFLDALTEVKLSPITRSIEEVIGRMKRNDRSQTPVEEDYFLLTDFQKSTFSSNSPFDIDTSNNYSIVPLTFSNTSNVFVDSLYLSNPFLLKDNTNELIISIKNIGLDRAEDLIVKLMLNNEQAATAGISIDPQTSEKIKFEIDFNLQDENNGVIVFEDFPVTFDNSFFFTLNTTRKVNIVELKGSKASSVLSQLYANNPLFEFSNYNIENFDYNILNTADLIFLNEADGINDAIKPYLKEFINNGGIIVIIFGEQPAHNQYSFLTLPESFSINNQGSNISRKTLDQPDYSNPFFENIFDSSEEVIEMPQATNTISWRTDGMKILAYRDGTPYISESGMDNIFFIGSPLKDEFTNFHRQAIFVPIMYRLAALSQIKNDRLYYEISDSQIQLRKEALASTTDILKLTRNEIEIIPSQYFIDNAIFLEIPKYTLNPGFYSLMNREDTVKNLAFNFNKEESLLSQLSDNEINEMFQDEAKVFTEDNARALGAELKEVYSGKQLWKYCLALALFFLLLEIVLIRYVK